MVLRPQLVLLGVVITFAGCGWTPTYGAPDPKPSPAEALEVDIPASTEALAKEIAFFEAQGDSGIAVEAARQFDAKTGCTSGWTLGYWQEEQRAEEVVARAGAMVELDKEYDHVVSALADAILPLPYVDQDGQDQVADFVGVLVAVNCP